MIKIIKQGEHLRTLLLALALLLFGCEAKQENNIPKPFLYKVEFHNNTSYIFGTYHTKDPSLANLNETIIQTIKKTDQLYTELGEAKVSGDIETFAQLPKPTTISQRFSPKLAMQINQFIHLNHITITTTRLANYKTWAIDFILTNLTEDTKFEKLPIMDDVILQIAKKNKIQTGALEEWQEQLASINSLSESDQQALLSYDLQSTTDKSKKELRAWYLSGNLTSYEPLEYSYTKNSTVWQQVIQAYASIATKH